MNSKNKKILILLFVGIIASGMAFYASYKFLNPQRITMYVFNDNYPAGTTLTEDMLTPVAVDSKVIVSGNPQDTSTKFVTGLNIKEVLKKSDALRMDVSDGMPLTLAILSSSGGSKIEQGMEKDKIAVSVAVSGITGVTDDLKEGSRVNIYTIDANTGAAVLVLQNMRVLATKNNDNSLTSATIECDQNQALQLTYYSSQSSIYFGLVDGSNYQSVEGTPSFRPDVTQKNN